MKLIAMLVLLILAALCLLAYAAKWHVEDLNLLGWGLFFWVCGHLVGRAPGSPTA